MEALQVFDDGVGHGDVNIVFWVAPIDDKYTLLAVIWVNSDGVIFPECIEEVGGVVGGE